MENIKLDQAQIHYLKNLLENEIKDSMSVLDSYESVLNDDEKRECEEEITYIGEILSSLTGEGKRMPYKHI